MIDVPYSNIHHQYDDPYLGVLYGTVYIYVYRATECNSNGAENNLVPEGGPEGRS
jgi:hypothetical protein